MHKVIQLMSVLYLKRLLRAQCHPCLLFEKNSNKCQSWWCSVSASADYHPSCCECNCKSCCPYPITRFFSFVRFWCEVRHKAHVRKLCMTVTFTTGFPWGKGPKFLMTMILFRTVNLQDARYTGSKQTGLRGRTDTGTFSSSSYAEH